MQNKDLNVIDYLKTDFFFEILANKNIYHWFKFRTKSTWCYMLHVFFVPSIDNKSNFLLNRDYFNHKRNTFDQKLMNLLNVKYAVFQLYAWLSMCTNCHKWKRRSWKSQKILSWKCNKPWWSFLTSSYLLQQIPSTLTSCLRLIINKK